MLATQTFDENSRSNKKKESLMPNDIDKLFAEIKRLEKKINDRFDGIDGRLDSIDNDLSEIKDDIRKIGKFVPIDNADFNVHVTQANSTKKKRQ